MTSNGEREFPAPFLRRCLRLEMPKPDEPMLRSIVESRLEEKAVADKAGKLIRDFLKLKIELFNTKGQRVKGSKVEEVETLPLHFLPLTLCPFVPLC
jgi:MoxR-like ATPase